MRKVIAAIISCLGQLRALAVAVVPVETAIALRVGEVFSPPAALIPPFSRRRQRHEQIIRGYPMTTRATPPFDLDRFLSKLDHGRTIKTYRRGQVIFAQGDVAKATFFIRTGKVKLTVVSASGREAVVGILGPRDFFGVGCVFGHPRRVSTATALTEASIIRIDKLEMTRTLRDNSQVCDSFMTNLVSRGLRLREDLIDQLFNPSEKRLARALLLLDNFGKEGSALITDITQETLAEMVGTTRARVNFFMNKFRKLGFIDYDNTGIRVHSSLERFLPRH
jgi:CRP-like cAMP-binding protein